MDRRRPAAAAVTRAAEVLRRGGLVAFPTETVYGLGADALRADAVRRVFAVKGRPAYDPIIVHVSGAPDLASLASALPEVALQLAEAFWPGPLTLVVPRAAHVPDVVTAGLDSVAVRCPAHPVALALLRAFGGPVAAPSANLFGRASPTTAAHVVADLGASIDLVLDAGPCPIGVESTVVDCRSTPPRLLRPGGVPIEDLARWSAVPGDAEPGTEARSPGLLPRHYAPEARLVVARASEPRTGAGAGPARAPASARALAAAGAALAAEGHKVVLLVADEDLPLAGAPGPGLSVRSLGSIARPEEVARRLYAALRAADDGGAQIVLVRDFGAAGLAAAVRDRLTRASAGRVVAVEAGAEAEAVERIVALARRE